MAKSRKKNPYNGLTIDVANQKLRTDALLLTRGLARSRDRARDLIAEGAVLAAGEIVRKASKMLAMDCDITVTSAGNPWVSRAGMKLALSLIHISEPTRPY